MRVFLSPYGSRRDVESTLGFALHVKALGAKGCDEKVATGVLSIGVCR